jgi:hypothetical protein
MAGKKAKQIRNQEKKLEVLKKLIFEEGKQRYYDNLSGSTIQIKLNE